MKSIVVAAALVAIAGLSTAEPVTLTLTSSSSISVDGTLDTVAGSASDSDSSPVTGTITVELNSYGTPTSVTLHDFDIAVSQSLNLDFGFGFLGSIATEITSASAAYAGVAPTGPEAVAGDTTFYFPSVLTNLTGNGTANGSILFVGTINETFDLADFNPFDNDFAGSVSVSGDTVSLSGTIEFAGSSEVYTGVTMNISGTLTIDATGTAPAPCIANFNGDDVLDFFDIQAFLAAFSNNEQSADVVDDEVFNFFDIQYFLAAFSAGCP